MGSLTVRPGSRSTRTFIAISILLAIMVGSTGCIDMEFMDFVLPRHEETVVVYEPVNKIDISYYFDNLTFPGTPSQTRKEINDREFRILEDTEWMKIEISVSLDKNELFQELIELLGINTTLTRHVKITFTDPKNRVWQHREFYETETTEPEVVYSPEPGLWTLDVYAKGIGGEIEGFQLHDGFEIRVFAMEPNLR